MVARVARPLSPVEEVAPVPAMVWMLPAPGRPEAGLRTSRMRLSPESAM